LQGTGKFMRHVKLRAQRNALGGGRECEPPDQ
jgi:hypothetical protein